MDELTRQQSDELHADLVTLQHQLRSMVESATAGARPVELDQPIGRVSRMDAIQQQRMVSAGREAHKVRLSQIVRALAAFGRGEYGLCVECEEPIGYRRLKARPETSFCLRCQGARETR